MPSLKDVILFREAIFRTSMALIEKKGHDYNRKQQHAGDTLFNLKVCELLGIVPTAERGILVRLSDKFMRLISLMESSTNPATDESLTDTVVDIHNYVDYALQLFLERRANAQKDCCKEASDSELRIGASNDRKLASLRSEALAGNCAGEAGVGPAPSGGYHDLFPRQGRVLRRGDEESGNCPQDPTFSSKPRRG